MPIADAKTKRSKNSLPVAGTKRPIKRKDVREALNMARPPRKCGV